MPTPLYKILLPTDNGYCLAGNPIMMGFWTGDIQSARYRIYTGSNLDVLEYDGMISSISEWAWVDVASIFSSMKNTAGVTRAKIVMVDDAGVESGSAEHTPDNIPILTIFGGGISKLLVRMLAGNNSNIFSWKLKDSTTNFFLTTRTNSFTIAIPENELMPLYYYAKGLKFDIKVDDTIVMSKDHTADIEETLQFIDFSALRLQLVGSINKLVSAFRIVTVAGWSCSIVITQAETPTDFQLKFKNSWGVWEKISLHNVVNFTPAIGEATKINQFDAIVNDFVSTTSRKSIGNIFTAESGYKTANERFFLMDMLSSKSVLFVTYGREYACNVTTDTTLIASTMGDPISVNLKIELQDAGEFFSPVTDEIDYNILTSSDGSDITTDGANILV
jgi:hypothetical protein